MTDTSIYIEVYLCDVKYIAVLTYLGLKHFST